MIFNAETNNTQDRIFGNNSLWLRLCLLAMFLLAALFRRDEIRAPGHLIEREYNSAIYARAFYFENNGNVESWRKDNARAARDRLPLLEPPLTEYLVSLIYRIAGHEQIWYARYLTGLFWLVGGLFLYKTVRLLVSADTAVIAVGYYLFVPWGVIISRSFQPDSLMMMMFMVSLFSLVKYFEKPTWRSLILAGILTGITLFLRPLVLFSLFGAFIAMSIHRKGGWLHVFNRQTIIFFFLSTIFALAFYGSGIFITGSLNGQASLSFRPHLLANLDFWIGWFENVAHVVGIPFLVLAIIGFMLLPEGLTRSLAVGLALGYLFFGLVFTFHIHSHPYYNIQLFPLVGICIAPVLIMIWNALRKAARNTMWLPVTVCLLTALFFSYSQVVGSLNRARFEDPDLSWQIGEAVGHSPNTVFVAYHYGLPLEYYGEFSGAPWPVRIDDSFYRPPGEQERSVHERLDELGFVPEYFIITDFDLYNRKHKDLSAYLEENCSIHAKTEQYLIYASCRSREQINVHPLPDPSMPRQIARQLSCSFPL